MLELSKADRLRLEMLIRGLISIGRPLPAASRQFYVAWLYQLADFGDDVLTRIGQPLEVLELSQESRLFAQWGDALERGDHKTCTDIEVRLDALGASNDARAILPTVSLAANLVAATLPTMDYFNKTGKEKLCL